MKPGSGKGGNRAASAVVQPGMSARTVAVLALVLLLAGCATRSPGAPVAEDTVGVVMPADFGGTVDYGNGSLPPPHHYEWRVTIAETTAEVEWRPGYDEAEPWRQTVDVTAAQRERCYELLRDAGVFELGPETDEEMVGGPTGSVELVAGGRTHDPGTLGTSRAGQDVLDDVVAAIEELVPADVWSGFRDQQEQWAAEHPG